MLPFKVNYKYKLKILLTLQQVKKTSETAKKKNREAYVAILKSLRISQTSIKKNEKVLQLKSI